MTSDVWLSIFNEKNSFFLLTRMERCMQSHSCHKNVFLPRRKMITMRETNTLNKELPQNLHKGVSNTLFVFIMYV